MRPCIVTCRRLCLLLLVVWSLTGTATALFSQPEMHSEKCQVAGGKPQQEYFLIHRKDAPEPSAGYRLLLVMPGGDGSADFHGFVTNIAKFGLGEQYIVAQLISIKWTPDQNVIWPTEQSKVRKMKFTTEDYIEAVIKDVAKSRKLDPEHIYTLSWSSSGPAAYAASGTVKAVKGSFVAMSVFKKSLFADIADARGHRYYIYHSPDDRVCPYRMAENARDILTDERAEVEFATYAGGHGWHGNVFGEIRKGMAWLEKR